MGSGTKFKNYSPYKDIKNNPSQTKIQDSIYFTQSFLHQNNLQKNNEEENLFFSAENEQEKEFDIHKTSL